ncbi:hypothetical protein BT63DRAFT_428632 [Microthyrium microscopicum]|uniref:GDSL lipase/acylhydrolase family protein n=1 Tax=Microthyrium microscopicum TaxID=703497 RepID=A0A6A6U348_9PEZI|nr:hypothetical protein BT63DRAFT_428632 [Microthyrium microscopicum]
MNSSSDSLHQPPRKTSLLSFVGRRTRTIIGAIVVTVLLVAIIITLSALYGTQRDKTHANSDSSHKAWELKNFKTLVVFGDSYSDEGRGLYINQHGTWPPVGWQNPVTDLSAVGGYVWPRWTAWYSGGVSAMHNYAVGGSVCSITVTPKNGMAYDIQNGQMSAFLADIRNSTIDVPADETVYAIWIGTNDLGVVGFVQDAQGPGQTLNDYVECVFTQFDRLYQTGARKFVLMNNIPLNRAPMYALKSNGGLPVDQYWPNKPNNLTAISYRMAEIIQSVNTAFKYQSAYEMVIGNRYKGAQMAYFDVHSLFMDMYNSPSEYFNGSQEATVTVPCLTCKDMNYNNCTLVGCMAPDAHMWYDELHPSEQSSRMVAKEFTKLVQGDSSYATYWS